MTFPTNGRNAAFDPSTPHLVARRESIKQQHYLRAIREGCIPCDADERAWHIDRIEAVVDTLGITRPELAYALNRRDLVQGGHVDWHRHCTHHLQNIAFEAECYRNRPSTYHRSGWLPGPHGIEP